MQQGLSRVKRDIIIIGASAGGVEALSVLVSTLPYDIPAAIVVVLHTPPWGRSQLPEILARRGPVPAAFARDNEAFETGRIYVAPQDHHLLIEKGRAILWRGPRENRSRPAVNATLRSGAEAYGARVTGVILTGALDDGSAGLWWVKRRGGAAVVQDPAEAAFPDMPNSALEYVDSVYIARLAEMGPLLTRLATGDEERDLWNQKLA
jgi:two-component system, chemotaxis family, protein-glutamate methylesterase/glutaminase